MGFYKLIEAAKKSSNFHNIIDDTKMRIRIYILMDMYRSKDAKGN
jgi:hypothetical protein